MIHGCRWEAGALRHGGPRVVAAGHREPQAEGFAGGLPGGLCGGGRGACDLGRSSDCGMRNERAAAGVSGIAGDGFFVGDGTGAVRQ
jgi:hypothetical protein